MRIVELFKPETPSKDVEWRRLHGNSLGGAGYEIIVHRPGKDHLEYTLDLAATPIKGLFEVSFVLSTGDTWSFEIEKTGSAFLVFSGVANAMRDWKDRTPDAAAIYFTAKEPTRARLYRTIAQTMARELGWQSNPKLAELMSGGWESGYHPFVVVKPGSENDIAQSIMSGD